jgi:SAM-dependent methyltransferase
MSSNVKSYFESHSHNYSKSPEFYSSVVNQIKITLQTNSNAKLLDVGCGDGNFVKALIKEGLKMRYFATDISYMMVKTAKTNLVNNCDVELFVADAFNIPTKSSMRFDVIHIDSVLHHLIGRTRGKSMVLIKEMLQLLMDLLSDKGILILEEWYYVSYLIPRLTSFIVFYGLKLLNSLKLDLSSYTKEIRPGLEVNFLHPGQLSEILSRYGCATLLHKRSGYHGMHNIPGGVPASYRLFLLKDSGHIAYMLKSGQKEI